jgi:cytochrome c oxidase subunit 2
VLTAATALVLTGIAAAGNGGLLPPDPHSPNAHRITDAYIFVAVFTGIIFLLVEGALVAFVLKYRRGRRARTAEGPQIHGSTRLEIIWTVVPVLILAAIGTFVFYKLPGIQDAPANAAGETKIVVEGHQFYWLFRYPNGALSIGTMVAPADTVVREEIVAPDHDVNHSWWVPQFGGKFDAIPGSTNHTWFKAPPGTYVARCAELCGIQHAKMDANVEVVPRSDYDAFVAARKEAPPEELGKEEFQNVCMVCHELDRRTIGPPLRGNPVLGDRTALTTPVRNGFGRLPAVGHNCSQEQVDALIAYTKRYVASGDGS